MRRGLWVVLGVGALSFAGCKDQGEGGFGKAKNEQPGVHVKPDKKAAEDVLPDFQSALKVTPTYNQESGEVTVTLAIADGFHAYAPGEETGVPVSLAVDNKNGWVLDGDVKLPAGQEKDLGPDLGKSVILEGAVPITAKVKGGEGDIEGSVKVQICTNKSCDRPRDHAFSTPSS